MYALRISRHNFLQVTSVPVKGLASLQPYSQEVGKQRRGVQYPGVKPFSAIPGPPSLPIIGTILDYYRGKYSLQQPYETYSKFLKIYGPLVRERVFLGQTLLHVFHPQDFKEVYFSEGGALPIRHSHKALKKYRESKKDLYGHVGVAPSNGEEWYSYRKLFNLSPVLSSPVLPEAFEEIADDLIEYMRSNLDHNREISLFPALYYYTLESIGMLVLGKRMGCFDQDRTADVTRFIEAVHESHYAIHQTEHKPYLLARKAHKTLEVSQDYIADFVLKHMNYMHGVIVRESEKSTDSFDETGKSDDLVIDEDESNYDRLSRSVLYQKLKEGMNRRMLLPMAVDFFQGGIHSTAHSLAFSLYHLAMNPDKQEIFREELIKVLPNKIDRIARSLRKSKYAVLIMIESLRLNPPTIGTGRVLGKDLVLSGYHVPKGTKVILHHEIASKQEDNFPQALRFLPGRLMSSYASKPFIDISRRMCMGKSIAEYEMRMALVKICRHFEVSYHHKEVGVVNYLVNEPDQPIKLRLKEIPDNVPRQDDTIEGNKSLN